MSKKYVRGLLIAGITAFVFAIIVNCGFLIRSLKGILLIGFNSFKISLLFAAIILLIVGLLFTFYHEKVSSFRYYKQYKIIPFVLLLMSCGYLFPSVTNFKALYVDNNMVFLLYVVPVVIGTISLLIILFPKVVTNNIIVFLVFFVVLEIIFAVKPTKKSNYKIFTKYSITTPWVDKHNTVTGFLPKKNTSVHVEKVFKGKNEQINVIYSAEYNFDALSRRKVPKKNNNFNKFLLFFGGSRTFGEGVNNNETIPYYVSAKLKDYRPYSYSFSGWGPSQFLAILQDRSIENEIKEHKGVVIYFMISSHISRTIGTYRIATKYNNGYCPYFRRDENNNIVRDGMFVNGRPFKQFFYSLLSESNIFNYFVVDFPHFHDEHYMFTADILKEIKTILSQKFKIEKFIVFYHPGNNSLKKMSQFLDERNIQYISLIDLFKTNDKRYIHSKYDTHLNAIGNRLVAQKIIKQISNK